MKLRKMLISVVLISLLVIGLCVIWLSVAARSVIWTFKERGDPSGEPGFVIFNPFREKRSEAEAEKVLNLLKNGKCEKVVQSLEYKESYTNICEKEALYTLEDWKLSNRRDGENVVRLFYRVKRMSQSDYVEGVWIDLEQTRDGWKVKDIEAIY
ncbi:MAG: hypothetical protein LC113_10665 [Acidobacteria bacterium]|nr:hypothetical protein [Acidobacteriota bacterium]